MKARALPPIALAVSTLLATTSANAASDRENDPTSTSDINPEILRTMRTIPEKEVLRAINNPVLRTPDDHRKKNKWSLPFGLGVSGGVQNPTVNYMPGYEVQAPGVQSTYSAFNASAQTEVTLGCDGRFDADMVSNWSSQLQDMWDNIKDNAAGLAMNYLIYSSPTLYDVMQNLNTAWKFDLNASIMSCSGVRGIASRHRKEMYEKAKNDCMQGAPVGAGDTCTGTGGDSDSGLLGAWQDMHSSYVQTKKSVYRSALANDEVTDEYMPPKDADNPEITTHQLILAMDPTLNENFAEFFFQVVPDMKTTDKGHEIIPAEKTLDDYMTGITSRRLSLLKSIIMSGGPFNVIGHVVDDPMSLNASVADKIATFNAPNWANTITLSGFQSLENLHNRNPQLAEGYMYQLVYQQIANYVRRQVNKIKKLRERAQANTYVDGVLFDRESVREHYDNAIESLQTQVSGIELKTQGNSRSALIMDSIDSSGNRS